MGDFSEFKITDADILAKGVIASPDTLVGTAAQNKAIFDRLVSEVVKAKYNDMLHALETDISDYLGESEDERRANETQRQHNEYGYTDEEEVFHNGRVQNETARQTAETARDHAENGYTDDQEVFHNGRVQAENERVAAENARNVWETYDAAHAYVPGNKVAYDGSSYVCTAACTGIAPPDTDYWTLIAARGRPGQVSDAVPLDEDSSVYFALGYDEDGLYVVT